MKSFLVSCLLTSFVAILSGCAGDEADFEKAEYLLAKGGTANALTVVAMMQSKCTTGSYSFEGCRLYSGAKMQAAGFDGNTIISKLAFNDGGDPIELLRNALTFNSNTATFLTDAETALDAFIANTVFTSSTNDRQKNGIRFQLGLVNFFEAIQATLDATQLSTAGATLSQEDCEDRIVDNAAEITQSRADLTASETSLTASGLDSTNDIVTMVTEFRDQIPSATITTQAEATALCVYIVRQSN